MDDYAAIGRLQSSYADVVSRRAWRELHELFLPDAEVVVDTVSAPARSLVGPDQLGEFIADATKRFAFFEFVILNAVVELAGTNIATGRVWMCEMRHDTETDQPSQAFGLYRDEYRRSDDRWWISARRYRSLYRLPAGQVLTQPSELD